MARTPSRNLSWLGAALLTLITAQAVAQTVTATTGNAAGLPGGNAISPGHALSTLQTARNPNQVPAFHVFGAPVIIAAPVDPPYNAASAYGTYAGQPGYGPNALLAASVGGQGP